MARDSITTLCGSLSRHAVSLGARMHRAGYAALGLDFAYVPFEIREDDLEGALRGMRALGIRGFGVSMPFKQLIVPLLDRLDDLAAKVKAVNTVVNDGGTLVGYNTDAFGAVEALREVTELHARRAVVIGAGGAARAVAFALAAEGVEVRVLNRTASRADELAEELREHFGAGQSARRAATANETGHETGGGGLDQLEKLAGQSARRAATANETGFHIVVNASSAGMAEYGGSSPVSESALRPGLVVMDIVYKPIETELLRLARRRGCATVHGGRMLLHQACRQFELYTGRAAPLEVMDRALREAIGG